MVVLVISLFFHIHLIQDSADDGQTGCCILTQYTFDDLPVCMAAFHYHYGTFCFLGHEDGVRCRHDRRGINDNKVKVFFQIAH